MFLQEDYNAYYGGISNGLLWPALHNLAEYIVKEYDDPAVSFVASRLLILSVLSIRLLLSKTRMKMLKCLLDQNNWKPFSAEKLISNLVQAPP